MRGHLRQHAKRAHCLVPQPPLCLGCLARAVSSRTLSLAGEPLLPSLILVSKLCTAQVFCKRPFRAKDDVDDVVIHQQFCRLYVPYPLPRCHLGRLLGSHGSFQRMPARLGAFCRTNAPCLGHCENSWSLSLDK